MKVYVLNLASPAAVVMLKEPQLWPYIFSNSNTVIGLKADLIKQQLAQDINFKLQLCTDLSTNIWAYESAFQVQLPFDTLYVRMEPSAGFPPAPAWWFANMNVQDGTGCRLRDGMNALCTCFRVPAATPLHSFLPTSLANNLRWWICALTTTHHPPPTSMPMPGITADKKKL